jgi:two-component system sporulation sensor kinase C
VGRLMTGKIDDHRASKRDLLDRLQRSEAQCRSTVDSITDGLHVVDRDLRVILMNKVFLEWHEKLGLPKDVVGKRLSDLYVFLPAGVWDEYRRVFTTGEVLVTEEQSRVGNLDILTETRKIPVFDNGEVRQVITIVRDITDRKRMDLALRQSEAWLRTLAEQSPNMIFVSVGGRVIYANMKCVETLGYTREELYAPGFNFLCLIAPECVDGVAEVYSGHLRGRSEFSHECTMVSKSGVKTECIISFAVIGMDEGGALLGVATDITDRKRAEDALRSSEEKYRSFVENFHGIAYRGGLDGPPLFFHGDVRRITGYTEGEFLGGDPKWVDIIHPEDRMKFGDVFLRKELPEADRPLELEYRIRRKDGQVRWIHQSVRPFLDSSGDAIYLQGAIYDVTARRLAEDSLERERNAFGVITEVALLSADVDDACKRVLPGLVESLGFDAGTIRLFDPGTHALRLVGAHGFTAAEVERYISAERVDDIRYVTGEAGRTVEPIWAPDVSGREDLKPFADPLAEMGIRSVISWPLISSDHKPLGVISFLGREPRDIPEENRGLFRTVSGMCSVVLERKRAEAALRSSEARYRDRFDNSPIALWEEDFSGAKRLIDSLKKAGVDDFRAHFSAHPEDVIRCAEAIRIISPNKAALALYATGTIEEFARVSTDNIRTQTLEAFRRGLSLAAEGSTEFDLDCEIRTALGENRYVRLRWSVAPGCERSLERVLVSVEDLTERKEAEEIALRAEIQLRRYSEELEEMVKDRTARIRELEHQRAESEKLAATGRMAARIAHEINNPLAGIKNSFLLLEAIMDKEHPHYQYAKRVENEIDRIAHIIRKMFDLYRPDVMKRTEMCLGEVIRDVTGIMESAFRAGGIDVVLDLPSGDVTSALPVGYLNQVLFNLLQNALEASREGGVVTVRLRTDGDSVAVEVSDLGCGVPNEAKERIFEPFFTTKGDTGGKGLGLGLAVSKGMVEAMGGSIVFSDNSPCGTVFRVTLPL